MTSIDSFGEKGNFTQSFHSLHSTQYIDSFGENGEKLLNIDFSYLFGGLKIGLLVEIFTVFLQCSFPLGLRIYQKSQLVNQCEIY